MGQNQRRSGCFVQFAKWQHRGAKSAVSDCMLFLCANYDTQLWIKITSH